MGRSLLREGIPYKDCRVYNYVYVKKQFMVFFMFKDKVVQRDE